MSAVLVNVSRSFRLVYSLAHLHYLPLKLLRFLPLALALVDRLCNGHAFSLKLSLNQGNSVSLLL